MMQLRHLVLLLWFMPSGARRTIRVEDAHASTQQQTNMLADGIEAAVQSRDKLIPGFSRLGGPRAKPVGRRAGHTEVHRAVPWSRSSPRRTASPVASLQDYGISSTPLASLAITAMDANNRRNQGQDVTMMALQDEIESGLSSVDPETRGKLAKVISEVDVESREALLAGITDPVGFFDPLAFATTDISGGRLLFYREVELKHGRVAMLASLGILVGEQFHPLFGGDIDVPAYVAFQQTPLQSFWPAVVAAIAIPEIFSVFSFQDPSAGAAKWEMKLDHVPGDLGFDPLGLKPTDPKELKEMRNKELNNGRLAMIATAGLIAQELASGQKIF
jgi:hypothetical protein